MKTAQALQPLLRIAFTAVFAFVHSSSGTAYRAEGRIEIYEGKDQQNVRGFNFIATVDRKKWQIRTQPHSFLTNSKNAAIEYYEAGTDGTNVFWLALHNRDYDSRHGQRLALAKLLENEQQLLNDKSDKQTLDKVQSLIATISKNLTNNMLEVKPTNAASGSISEGCIPEFKQEDLISAVWLSLCSGSYLTNLPYGIVPAIFDQFAAVQSNEANQFVSADSKLVDQAPHLPRFIQTTNNGLTFRIVDTEPPTPSLHSFGSLRKDAHVTMRYEANNFTNFGNLLFPQEFKITTFLQNNTTNFIIRGTINNIKTNIAIKDFLPVISVVTAIQDNRLAKQLQGMPARFFVNNGLWPTVEQVQATPIFKQMKSTADISRKAGHWATRLLRVGAYGALLVAMLAPALIFVWRALRKNHASDYATSHYSPPNQT